MERKTKSITAICIGLGLLCMACLFVALWVMGFLDIFYTEIQMRRPSLYKPVAGDMAVLASHLKPSATGQSILEKDIGWAWRPDSLHTLPPMYVMLDPNSVIMVFGGGFYPLAYNLLRNQAESDPNRAVWDLYLCHENRGPKLYTYCVTKGERAIFVNLIRSAAAEYDRQIADHPDSEEYKTQKENYLELFNVKLDDDGALQMPQP